MTTLPLRLGPLGAPGHQVICSGLRWLAGDGHVCRANEVVAYCNIDLLPAGRARADADPFGPEYRDFQVGFAPRVAGILRRAPATSQGGFLDQLPGQIWAPDFVAGHLEVDASAVPDSVDAGELRLLVGCARRVTELAEVRAGFLTGWHNRSRAWWSDSDCSVGTLLSLGICEQAGVVRGEGVAFADWFAATAGPAQVVFVPDDALVPCTRVLAEQLRRQPEEAAAILADMTRALATGPVAPTPADWLFAGALQSALAGSPLAEHYDVLARNEVRRDASPDAVLLSLHAETDILLRHRRLGYSLKCHRFRMDDAGPALRAWLRTAFEPVERSPEEIRRDYVALIDAMRSRAKVEFLVMNCMSTSGAEDIHSYAAFDRPMRRTLATIRSKEVNLMLHDLARERDVAIVDVDAIAAELGAGKHLPDGVHASGALQAEIRAEVTRILHARGVRGFAPTALR